MNAANAASGLLGILRTVSSLPPICWRRGRTGALAGWLVLGSAPATETAHDGLSRVGASADVALAEPPSPRQATPGDRGSSVEPETLEQQRTGLIETLRRGHDLAPAQLENVARIIARSAVLGLGNPGISVHPIGRDECLEASRRTPLRPGDPGCDMPRMVPLYDPGRETPADARVCIDQFEFPDVPCEYPVVHVSAREAVQLCEAIGKRLCDAHEWEGACAGALLPADSEYAFGLDRRSMRGAHNRHRELVWAYGTEKDHTRCATTSFKTPGCPGSGYERCGSNTFPTGSFPGCVSPLGVYDLHGNVAEHMNLPLRPSELGSAGGHGSTEMKGSWFIFAATEAHPDDCRWRAPDWHGSSVTSARSHSNYHLGFRCCRDVVPGGERR